MPYNKPDILRSKPAQNTLIYTKPSQNASNSYLNFTSAKSFLNSLKEKFDFNKKDKVSNIAKMFIDANVSNIAMDGPYCKEFIYELAKHDFNTVRRKYIYLNKIEEKRTSGYPPLSVKNMLSYDDITIPTLMAIKNMAASIKNSRSLGIVHDMETIVKMSKSYPNFDKMTTKNQSEYIASLPYYFNSDYINNLDDYDILLQFPLVREIKNEKSVQNLQQKLIEKAKNAPVAPILVNEKTIKEFMDDKTFSYENLYNTIGNFDIKKYKKGLTLEYSRDDFIDDFENLLSSLIIEDERQRVYDYFKFYIDENKDIINYPIPNNSDISEYSKPIQKAIIQARKLVNKFMLDNKIKLKQDKKTDEVLNKLIKVFPEFISVIGKIQHRGDSIDFHTLEDLKLCLNNPETKKLSKNDFRILFISVLFHDISKKQKKLDVGHQKNSAFWAKEIIKKLPITSDDRERIYSLILNSHWVTDANNKDPKNLGAELRYFNDFKLAQILAKADTFSTGFDYSKAVDRSRIEMVESCINRINSTGIPLFADGLPKDKSKFKTKDGIKYLDFTDKEKDLTEFGFKKGTKVKDLHFLCHSSSNSLEKLYNLCDDSKNICVSAEYKNAADGGLLTNYNLRFKNNCHVILHSSNFNIALGGKDVLCTGNRRGFEEFKDYIYMENTLNKPAQNNFESNKKFRREISDILKRRLQLSDSEYAKFFRKVNEFSSIDEINDIKLSSNRTLEKEKIKNALKFIQKYSLGKDLPRTLYANEFVIFRPKIEALVMKKDDFFYTPLNLSEEKQTANKNNIPVILV